MPFVVCILKTGLLSLGKHVEGIFMALWAASAAKFGWSFNMDVCPNSSNSPSSISSPSSASLTAFSYMTCDPDISRECIFSFQSSQSSHGFTATYSMWFGSSVPLRLPWLILTWRLIESLTLLIYMIFGTGHKRKFRIKTCPIAPCVIPWNLCFLSRLN